MPVSIAYTQRKRKVKLITMLLIDTKLKKFVSITIFNIHTHTDLLRIVDTFGKGITILMCKGTEKFGRYTFIIILVSL